MNIENYIIYKKSTDEVERHNNGSYNGDSILSPFNGCIKDAVLYTKEELEERIAGIKKLEKREDVIPSLFYYDSKTRLKDLSVLVVKIQTNFKEIK